MQAEKNNMYAIGTVLVYFVLACCRSLGIILCKCRGQM